MTGPTSLRSRIAGCGAYLPERVVTNDELAARLDTSDAWIRQRTGIGERRIAATGELTSDLAFHASRRALERAGMSGSDLDLIVLATATPDQTFPSTAVKVQARLGMKQAGQAEPGRHDHEAEAERDAQYLRDRATEAEIGGRRRDQDDARPGCQTQDRRKQD